MGSIRAKNISGKARLGVELRKQDGESNCEFSEKKREPKHVQPPKQFRKLITMDEKPYHVGDGGRDRQIMHREKRGKERMLGK